MARNEQESDTVCDILSQTTSRVSSYRHPEKQLLSLTGTVSKGTQEQVSSVRWYKSKNLS
jgi:hypothetical protein